MSYQPNFSYLAIFQKPGWRAVENWSTTMFDKTLRERCPSDLDGYDGDDRPVCLRENTLVLSVDVIHLYQSFRHAFKLQIEGEYKPGVRTCLETTLLYQNRTTEELAMALAVCEHELLVAWDAICTVGRRAA
jgi:hypothetical protein